MARHCASRHGPRAGRHDYGTRFGTGLLLSPHPYRPRRGGFRTGNIWSPFPEEANRKLATPLVTLHFAPTESAPGQAMAGPPLRAHHGAPAGAFRQAIRRNLRSDREPGAGLRTHSSVDRRERVTLRWLRLRIPTVTDRAPIGLSNGSGVISQECKPARELDDVGRLTAHRIRSDPGVSAGVTRRCCPGVVSRQL